MRYRTIDSVAPLFSLILGLKHLSFHLNEFRRKNCIVFLHFLTLTLFEPEGSYGLVVHFVKLLVLLLKLVYLFDHTFSDSYLFLYVLFSKCVLLGEFVLHARSSSVGRSIVFVASVLKRKHSFGSRLALPHKRHIHLRY